MHSGSSACMRPITCLLRLGRDSAELRAYFRAHEKHTDYADAHIQHMKGSTFMNIQLHHVIAPITDVTGITGITVIRLHRRK
jgi:transposase